MKVQHGSMAAFRIQPKDGGDFPFAFTKESQKRTEWPLHVPNTQCPTLSGIGLAAVTIAIESSMYKLSGPAVRANQTTGLLFHVNLCEK
jgi:hypothetical protein